MNGSFSLVWVTWNRGMFLNIRSSALLLSPCSVLEADLLKRTVEVLMVPLHLLPERTTAATLRVSCPRSTCRRGVVLRLVASVLMALWLSSAKTWTQCPVLLLSMPS